MLVLLKWENVEKDSWSPWAEWEANRGEYTCYSFDISSHTGIYNVKGTTYIFRRQVRKSVLLCLLRKEAKQLFSYSGMQRYGTASHLSLLTPHTDLIVTHPEVNWCLCYRNWTLSYSLCFHHVTTGVFLCCITECLILFMSKNQRKFDLKVKMKKPVSHCHEIAYIRRT